MVRKTASATTISADALDDNQFSLGGDDQGADDKEITKEKSSRKRKRTKKSKTKDNSTSDNKLDDDVAAQQNSTTENAKDQDQPARRKRRKIKSKIKKANGTATEPNVAAADTNGDLADKSLDKTEKTPLTMAQMVRRRAKDNKKLKRAIKKEKAGKPAPDPLEVEKLDSPTESAKESSSIGLQPPDLQLNYLKDRQKRSLPDLSDLELDSLPLEKSWLQDVSDKPLRAHLGSWLKTEAVPGLVKHVNQPADVAGAPVVLVIASAALRAVDLCRQVKPLVENHKDSGEITKLFAKHFKLEEHIEHVKTAKISIGVGTPDRISKLLPKKDDGGGALKLDRLKFFILDATWLDLKGFSLTELPDLQVKASLWKSLLGCPQLINRFQSGQTKLVLF